MTWSYNPWEMDRFKIDIAFAFVICHFFKASAFSGVFWGASTSCAPKLQQLPISLQQQDNTPLWRPYLVIGLSKQLTNFLLYQGSQANITTTFVALIPCGERHKLKSRTTVSQIVQTKSHLSQWLTYQKKKKKNQIYGDMGKEINIT